MEKDINNHQSSRNANGGRRWIQRRKSETKPDIHHTRGWRILSKAAARQNSSLYWAAASTVRSYENRIIMYGQGEAGHGVHCSCSMPLGSTRGASWDCARGWLCLLHKWEVDVTVLACLLGTFCLLVRLRGKVEATQRLRALCRPS